MSTRRPLEQRSARPPLVDRTTNQFSFRQTHRLVLGLYQTIGRTYKAVAACAKPLAILAEQPDDGIARQVDFHAGRRHLPIVSAKRAA